MVFPALQLEKEGSEVGMWGEGEHSCCGQLAGVSVGFAERSELVMGYIGREVHLLLWSTWDLSVQTWSF